jgi:hypothetical protein
MEPTPGATWGPTERNDCDCAGYGVVVRFRWFTTELCDGCVDSVPVPRRWGDIARCAHARERQTGLGHCGWRRMGRSHRLDCAGGGSTEKRRSCSRSATAHAPAALGAAGSRDDRSCGHWRGGARFRATRDELRHRLIGLAVERPPVGIVLVAATSDDLPAIDALVSGSELPTAVVRDGFPVATSSPGGVPRSSASRRRGAGVPRRHRVVAVGGGRGSRRCHERSRSSTSMDA